MKREALSNLELANQLGGIAHTTVKRWREGSRPRGEIARKLATRFELPVDVLLDDRKALPATYIQQEPRTIEVSEAAQHLVHAPLRAAAAAADQVTGTFDDRQSAFEQYLRQIHRLRAEAEKLAAGDLEKAAPIFDQLMATWLAQRSGKPRKKKKSSDLVSITPKKEILEQSPSPSQQPRIA